MKKYKILALFLVGLMLISGCKKPPADSLLVEAVYPAQSSGLPEPIKYAAPTDFYKKATPILLADDGENSVCSPFSLYIALSALSECTEGNSRKQILDVLGSEVAYKNTDRAYELFRAANVKDTKLATSLWLDSEVDPLPSLKETLSTKLMTSLYEADFATDDAKNKISDWINQNTGNLLEAATENLEFNPNTVMAILSTVYFDGKWSVAFDKEKTAPDTFFAKSGEITTDFMNEFNEHDSLYTFSDSIAVTKRFSNGCEIAFILPNEDKTPTDVINAGEFYAMLTDSVLYTIYDINLSVPKFDILSDTEFIDGLKSLGVADIFEPDIADFTPLGQKKGMWINKLQQMTRITVSEEGVKAASGTIIGGTWKGEAEPVEEIDFKLNRPFVFMIMQDSVPLFVGTVNNPK